MARPLPPPPGADPALLGRLRQDLEDAGYTVDGVTAALGPVASAALLRERPLPAELATRDRREPVAVLTRLLVLGRPVPAAAVDAALPRTRTAGLASAGLVTTAGGAPVDQVQACVDLRPYSATDAAGQADWWVVSDLGEATVGGPLPPEHVLGVGGASAALAAATPRDGVGRVLDLGTGCGVQALHALRHARDVVATDVSRRALSFAATTLALNDVPTGDRRAGADSRPRVDLRPGSLLDPVAGEQFDLVVSNPPFVVTPRAPDVPTWTYRDGGQTGDRLVERLVSDLRPVLAPGGTAVLLGNWEHVRGQDWRERVGGWLTASGLDGWVVQREVQDPSEYAETWIRDGGQPPGPAFDALHAAWLADFAARDVEAVGLGMVVLHRPRSAGPAVRRVEEQRGTGAGPLGAHVATVMRTWDWLHASGALVSDEALGAARLRTAADVTEERHHRPGTADPEVVLLRQGGAFARTRQASTALAGLVGACDGELPVRAIVAALAALLDVPADDLAAELLPQVRELLHAAVLVPG